MNSPLLQTFIECLGWTLLHFVWQGIAIAALLAIALRLLRGNSAVYRYEIGCMAMLLLIVVPAFTFNHICRESKPTVPEVQSAPIQDLPSGETPIVVAKTKFISIVIPANAVSSFHERLVALLPVMVIGWALGVLIFSVRLFAGWLQIRQLKQTVILAFDDYWNKKFLELQRRLGIQTPLRLLQSALIEVPMVIGWLRPIILLPAGCLVGLSAAQLESILAHELAHIRRHDYLINLLQNFLETLLFYHPAVWWVSNRVREERENCCDDLAVEVCGDRVAYARALATLEELRHAPVRFALAANGAPLLQRIQRLAGKPDKNRSGWPLLAVLLLLLTAGFEVDVHTHHVLAVDTVVEAANNQPSPKLANDWKPLPPQTTVVEKPSDSTPQLENQKTEEKVPIVAQAVQKTVIEEFVPVVVPNNGTVEVAQNITPQAPEVVALNQTPAPLIVSDEPRKEAPQVHIEVKLVELDSKTAQKSEFLSLFHVNLERTKDYPVPPSSLAATNAFRYQSSTILSSSEKVKLINDLEKSDGVDELTAPGATAEIGRQVQIQAVTLMQVVTGMEHTNDGVNYTTDKLFEGPVIDLIPLKVTGNTIDLWSMTSITVFLGYDSVNERRGQGDVRGVIPNPRFFLREMEKKVSLHDGDTLVLGGVVDKLPKKLANRSNIPKSAMPPGWDASKPLPSASRHLLVFITPTLINPDGTPFHAKHAANTYFDYKDVQLRGR